MIDVVEEGEVKRKVQVGEGNDGAGPETETGHQAKIGRAHV